MENEQDLLIFPWGTNVSRLGDLTAPQTTTGRQWSQDQRDTRKWHSLSLAARLEQEHDRGPGIFQPGEHLLDRHTQLADAAASWIAARPLTRSLVSKPSRLDRAGTFVEPRIPPGAGTSTRLFESSNSHFLDS